jgi:citrate/tricarballylate utilization protein
LSAASLDVLADAGRQMSICNACRYCEGYCAVFPAMELRRTFSPGDLVYLANLCFDCRACLYACQYAPPHAFAVNVPHVFAEIRAETYKRYSWPGMLAPLLDRNLRSVLGLTALAVVAVLMALLLSGAPGRLVQPHTGPGAFYEIAPYVGLVLTASAIALYGVAVFVIGGIRFWRDTRGTPAELISLGALWKATADAFDLKYLRGGGSGCYYPADRRSQARRVHHQLVFFGFLADLASTTLAAIYQDVLGIMPPFALLSLPVILGTLGGVGMIVGSIGLLYLKWRSDRVPAVGRMLDMDVAFLVMLLLASITGMLTLIFRETSSMGIMFGVHLGVVAGLFFTAPYGKFAHVVYRYAALVRNSVEQRHLAQEHRQNQH